MRYTIYDNWNNQVLHTFNRKKDCKDWLLHGMFVCEGAERDHYVYMLIQFEEGKKTLCYWEN